MITGLRDELWLKVALESNHLNAELARIGRDLSAQIEATQSDLARVDERTTASIRRQEEAVRAIYEPLHALGALTLEEVRGSAAAIGELHASVGRIEHLASEAARRGVIPVDGDLMIKTRVGFVLCPVSDELLVAYLVESGDPEPGTRRVIEQVLRPGDVFVDAGANLGIHTLAAAARVGPGGRVVAFEPYGPTASLLRRSIAINGFSRRCEVHETALADSAGTEDLQLGITSGYHSLVKPVAQEEGEHAVRVDTRPLDEVLGGEARVDVLKIDVEGAELRVLRGATGVLTSNPAIVVIAELGGIHLQQAGVSVDDWLAAFTDLGFAWRRINAITGALERVEVSELTRVESCNLLFARPDTLADLVESE